MTVEEIIEKVTKYTQDMLYPQQDMMIVLTGGEPTLYDLG